MFQIWVSMKDVGSSIGVKSISDLVLKEIYGICETKNPTKEQVNEYKMTKREIYKKFTNFSKQELNTKNNKNPYVRNDVMEKKRCRGENTRGVRAIDGFRKKLMIPDSQIPKCPEFEAKSKIGKLGSGIVTNEPNYQLANELHKPIIRQFKKRKKFIHHLETISGVLI